MKIKDLGLSALLPILVSGIVSAADISATIKECNDCHGNNGVSQWTDVPTIAGMPAIVHEDALFIYRDNERPAAASPYRQGDTARPPVTMCAVVADLSDEDIVKIAAHYEAKPFVAAKQDF
ncbi:MAG: hypothetical protein HKM98_07925, partial [Gammaproteobacteria bacterium]|nr:hypothetical protein [Gammaproteobacteria bacterium]